jgi:peptidoglycan/LPS O-acetylase OafA/YrhL
VGVDIFFTLSGYLITTILLNQWVANGRIALGSFYLRRALRIWPAFLAMLIVYVAASSLQSSASTVHLKAAMAAALSIMNWVLAFAPMNGGFVAHSWSLSIEEQFYIIWPMVLILLLALFGRRSLTPILCGILAALLVWKAYLVSGGIPAFELYDRTDTHAEPILIGCILAAARLTPKIENALSEAWLIPVVGLLALLFFSTWSNVWMFWSFTAHGLLTAWIIVVAIGVTGMLSTVLSTRTAIWLGKRSYSVYLWHVPILHALTYLGLGLALRSITMIAASLGIAALSYRFIEIPFLKLRHARVDMTTSYNHPTPILNFANPGGPHWGPLG